jgi:hypothetical protein
MKLNVYLTSKILLLCALLSETIICSQTEAEGRFLMKAGFLKHKKTSDTPIPGSVRRSSPKLETVNLMQKSEARKNQNVAHAKQDMGAVDSLARKLADAPTNPNDPAPLDLNIGTGPVWVSAWIKFMKFFPSAKTHLLTPATTPKNFIINPQYNEQFKVNPKWDKKEKSKDDLGNDIFVNIVDRNQFYAKLVKDQIIILSARDVKNFIFLIFYYLSSPKLAKFLKKSVLKI